jgi:ADP-ribose pyrophosphatase
MRHQNVTGLEVVEDFSASARCDEGFLQIRRLRVRNRRVDGSHSPMYRVDVVDRPKLDAVAVLAWRRTENDDYEFLTRRNLRPAAYFRREKTPVVPEEKEWLFCEEIVAGLIEPSDHGEAAVRTRASEELLEEAGFRVDPESVRHLGPPFFVAPGIISEKIFLTHVEVTGLTSQEPRGDGSPLEEGGMLSWRSRTSLLAAIRSGDIQDAKTEIALGRFIDSRRA